MVGLRCPPVDVHNAPREAQQSDMPLGCVNNPIAFERLQYMQMQKDISKYKSDNRSLTAALKVSTSVLKEAIQKLKHIPSYLE